MFPTNRRRMLANTTYGLGSIALASLLNDEQALGAGPRSPLAPKQPHFEPKVKRVIFMFMQGGPSHIDLFDPLRLPFGGKASIETVLKLGDDVVRGVGVTHLVEVGRSRAGMAVERRVEEGARHEPDISGLAPVVAQKLQPLVDEINEIYGTDHKPGL